MEIEINWSRKILQLIPDFQGQWMAKIFPRSFPENTFASLSVDFKNFMQLSDLPNLNYIA